MIATVCKTFAFHAAHQLPNHDGKCRNKHGHTYKVEVFARGPVRMQPGHPKEGMVVDFGVLKSFWKSRLEPRLDHQDLNVTLHGEVPVTSAEWIARWILDRFTADQWVDLEGLPTEAEVFRVRVWETPTSYAQADSGLGA